MAETAERPSFDVFYACTAARLIRHAYALTGEMAEAQDIAQEAFARAWQRWPSVRECDSPEAWVRRVATNLAASRWRRIRLARTVAGHAAERHAPEVSTDSVALVSGLRTLPERQRTVLVLHYMCDLTVDQIAAELGCPAGSVKSWLSRGRTALAAAVRIVDPVGAEPAAESCLSAKESVNAAPNGSASPSVSAAPNGSASPSVSAAQNRSASPSVSAAQRLALHPVPSWPARVEPEASHG
jgi:RNA polymerase sigma-70 factor (ECF subfamily)